MSKIVKSSTVTKSAKNMTKISKVQKFLRLPIDSKTQLLIEDIIAENPFFTPLDAIRYILGKHIRQNNRKKMLDWLKQNVDGKNLPNMSEDEIFAIVESEKLAR